MPMLRRCIGISCCRGPDYHRQYIWDHWERIKCTEHYELDSYCVRFQEMFLYRNTVNNKGYRYFLTLTTFQPLYGKLSDIFGRKPTLLFAYSIFGLGCLFCGMARTMHELIAARAFAGIGGGGMTT